MTSNLGSFLRLTILTRTPSRVNHSANTKPVGPAPTMRTSVSRIDDALIVENRVQVWYRLLKTQEHIVGSAPASTRILAISKVQFEATVFSTVSPILS